MISVTCWKWRPKLPSGPRYFDSSHVNVLRAMVARHLPIAHRFICITDDTDGLDPRVEALPLPPKRFDEILPRQSNYNRRRPWSPRKDFPSCYRRLWNFSSEAKSLGPRILALDIDLIVTGSLLPLVERDEDFIGWCDEGNQSPRVAGGVYLLRTGSHTEVWDDFDPLTSPDTALWAGFKGSDQAWMSYKLAATCAKWGRADGLTKLTWTNSEPDESVRLVFTAGHSPPWARDVQRSYRWIKKHWCL